MISHIKDLSFLEKGFTKPRVLDIRNMQLDDMTLMTKLKNLEEHCCVGIPSTTSLLPLARCLKLKNLACCRDSEGFYEFRAIRPDIQVCIMTFGPIWDEDEDVADF